MVEYNPCFIEQLYRKRRKAHKGGPAAFDKELSESIQGLAAAYRAGKHPELNSDQDRLGYVIQYAPAGMAAVRRLVGGLRERVLPPPFSVLWDEPLRIVSVGAGPGTDLFGILMAFGVPPHGLSFTRIDIHKKWKDYFEGFRKDFREQVPQFDPVLKEMETNFFAIDLKEGDLRIGKCGEAIATAHVVVLNRVLSTFHADTAIVSGLIETIADHCASDSLLLVIDVSLPVPNFKEAVALTEGRCRLKKPKSKWISRFMKMEKSHFGWEIPGSIRRIEKYGWKILQSGSFFGGGVWLKK